MGECHFIDYELPVCNGSLESPSGCASLVIFSSPNTNLICEARIHDGQLAHRESIQVEAMPKKSFANLAESHCENVSKSYAQL